MKKFLVSTATNEDSGFWLVDPRAITDNVHYFTGEEGVYGWDGKEMVSLSDCFVQEGDYQMFFEQVDEDEVDVYIESIGLLVDLVEKGDYVEFDGRYFTPVDWVDFCDKMLTLEYDIKSEEYLIYCRELDVDFDIIEVDVELVDYIPQDYPKQPYVGIWEGTDEEGKRIRITETHPTYASDGYPCSEIEYIGE